MVSVFTHRYLAAGDTMPGYPVVSMYQTGVIMYGTDLANYLHNEFSDRTPSCRPERAGDRAVLVPLVGNHDPERRGLDIYTSLQTGSAAWIRHRPKAGLRHAQSASQPPLRIASQMGIEQMSDYDKSAWENLERWSTQRLSARARHLVPKGARDRLARTSGMAQQRFEDLPGATQFIDLFTQALDGFSALVGKAAEASLHRQAIAAAYRKHGCHVAELADIRKLELRDVDKIKPRLGLRYMAFSSVEGAAAGFAVSGGEILAGGGAVVGGGAGAAPGAGTIVGTLAVDAAATMAAMTRAVSHTAAYYGYDTELPEEQVFAAAVLNFGLAQGNKHAAYIELNKVVQQLARKASWEQLDKSIATRVIKIVYQRLGIKITKAKLGEAIPVVGIVIGAGINARLLAKVTSDADKLYRHRFLREQYNIPVPSDIPTPDTPEPASTDEDAIHIVDLISEEFDLESKE
jgi:hypothetical protein